MNKIYKNELKLINKNKKQMSDDNYNLSMLVILFCVVGVIFSIINKNYIYQIFMSFILGLVIGNIVTKNMLMSKMVDAFSNISMANKNRK